MKDTVNLGLTINELPYINLKDYNMNRPLNRKEVTGLGIDVESPE
jgi:hypothetical protein